MLALLDTLNKGRIASEKDIITVVCKYVKSASAYMM